MDINVAIDDFINYCIFEKGLSDKTKESYIYDLSVYKEFLLKKKITKVNNITTEDIENFLKTRLQNEKNSTVAHNLTVIKNFHSYLLKNDIVKKDISENIARPKLQKNYLEH